MNSISFIILLELLVIFSTNAITFQDLVNSSEWQSFRDRFKKFYKDEKMEQRAYDTLVKHKDLIETTNKKFELGKITFKLGLNKYADMPNEEFRKKMLTLKVPTKSGFFGFQLPSFTDLFAFFLPQAPKNTNLPPSIDWRNESTCVAPIKDQGKCGSCWAFSTVTPLEFANCKKNNGSLTTYSEQQLVDCSSNATYGNQGCNGGLIHETFQYVIDNGGIVNDTSYPYTSGNGSTLGKCNFPQENIVGKCTKYVALPEGDDNALQEAIVNQGAISVALDAGSIFFQLYKSGVYSSPDCSRFNLNHAVSVVGYGTQTGSLINRDYYILRNSWGTGWGDKGYMYIRRGNNYCGIASYASYAIV